MSLDQITDTRKFNEARPILINGVNWKLVGARALKFLN